MKLTHFSKFNLIYRLQKWMDSVPGQTFLNYAYSWGASVVILGTLFKLNHLEGADIMLYLGMGTEVFIFFISGFDRPFDKKTETELPEEVIVDEKQFIKDTEGDEEADAPTVTPQGVIVAASYVPSAAASIPSAEGSPIPDAAMGAPAAVDASVVGASAINASAAAVDAINNATAIVEQQQQKAPEMEEATANYIEELKKLTELLAKVSEQSERLTKESEEMENLDRTLTGICKIYEMQLKGASAHIGTIDNINAQSQKMAEQIAELNKMYTRMIEAMTINMRAAAPAQVNPTATNAEV